MFSFAVFVRACDILCYQNYFSVFKCVCLCLCIKCVRDSDIDPFCSFPVSHSSNSSYKIFHPLIYTYDCVRNVCAKQYLLNLVPPDSFFPS